MCGCLVSSPTLGQSRSPLTHRIELQSGLILALSMFENTFTTIIDLPWSLADQRIETGVIFPDTNDSSEQGSTDEEAKPGDNKLDTTEITTVNIKQASAASNPISNVDEITSDDQQPKPVSNGSTATDLSDNIPPQHPRS